ncbi:MAG: hypothetical protein RR319_07720 [Bacteroides sp.]
MANKNLKLTKMATTAVPHDSSTDLENGKKGQLYLFIGGLPIAFASSCGLDVTTEELDIANKMCGDWGASLPGKKSFTLSSESLLTRKEGLLSFDTLLAKQIAGAPIEFFYGGAKVTGETNVGGIFEQDTTRQNYKGKVMITSLSLKSDNGQIASCSASFKGIGALEPVSGVTAPGGTPGV